MRLLIVLAFLLTSNFINGQELTSFFNDADSFLSNFVDDNGKVNYSAIKQNDALLKKLTSSIEKMDHSDASISEKIAFAINAYNIMVISSVIKQYPITSVMKIRGFFNTPVTIAGISTDFDKYEKSLLPNEDPRLHMALVCAANSCPILLNEAYRPETIEMQLNKASRISLSKKHMFNPVNKELDLSKIFEWYGEDFDVSGGVVAFINTHTGSDFTNPKFNYLPYDWGLNDGGFEVETLSINVLENNKMINEIENQEPKKTVSYEGDNGSALPEIKKSESRYVVSSLYDKGGYDINFFNNYYIETSRDGTTDEINSRAIFLTNYLQFIYGINKRFNVGLDVKFRSVTGSIEGESSVFKALNYSNRGAEFAIDGSYIGYSRTGLTAIGPKVKFLPLLRVPKFSIQSTLFIPLINSESNDKLGYIDWTAPTWNTQLFYDHDITNKVSLFTEIDFIFENINQSLFLKGDGYSQVSTPVSLILSYFPSNLATVYLLYNSTPKWNHYSVDDNGTSSYDPYSQYGVGLKYFISNKVQAEFIYTKFHSTSIGKTAHTFNFGIRYFGTK